MIVTALIFSLASWHAASDAFSPTKVSSSPLFSIMDTRADPQLPARLTRVFLDRNKQDGSESDDKHDKKATCRPQQVQQSQFATGSALSQLRSDLAGYHENLKWARAVGDIDRVVELTQAIEQGEALDPEVVYASTLQQIAALDDRSELTEIEKNTQLEALSDRAEKARGCMPQFQLEGLWSGK